MLEKCGLHCSEADVINLRHSLQVVQKPETLSLCLCLLGLQYIYENEVFIKITYDSQLKSSCFRLTGGTITETPFN